MHSNSALLDAFKVSVELASRQFGVPWFVLCCLADKLITVLQDGLSDARSSLGAHGTEAVNVVLATQLLILLLGARLPILMVKGMILVGVDGVLPERGSHVEKFGLVAWVRLISHIYCLVLVLLVLEGQDSASSATGIWAPF